MRHGRDRADLSSQVRVLVALAVQDPADPDVAIAVLRGGIEDVVLPATFVDLDWHTTAITPADDLERDTTGLRSQSRDWQRLRPAAAELESGGVETHRQDVPRDPLPPEMTAKLAGLLPGSHTLAARGGGMPRRGLRLRDLRRSRRCTAAECVGHRDSGVAGGAGLERHVWGYGWGTLLSASLAEAVGGSAALSRAAGCRRAGRLGGQVWVRLGDDPAAVDRSAVAALREVLAPVLPVGRRTVEEYTARSGAPTRCGRGTSCEGEWPGSH